jgi:8-oxo-dGTP pyrophosphatase MutT (NUDIX family)
VKEKLKVIAYIFRNNRSEILVFDHRDIPEAGTQVVGGTVEANEDFNFALSREIKEESGLDIVPGEMTKIGETTYHRQDMPEVNHRHYFEILRTDLPETWEHTVVSDGLDNGMVFEFYWLPINEARDVLVGNFGELLP